MCICDVCGKEMNEAESCVPDPVVIGDRVVQRIAYVPYRQPRPGQAPVPCGDCGVQPGGFHHPGCDMEDCGNCGRQRLACGCEDPLEDEEDDFDGDGAGDACPHLTLVQGVTSQ